MCATDANDANVAIDANDANDAKDRPPLALIVAGRVRVRRLLRDPVAGGVLLGAALSLAVVGASHQLGQVPPDGPAVSGMAAEAPQGALAHEHRAPRTLAQRLARDPTLQALSIQVTVVGGRVRLRGATPDTATRHRVGAHVAAIAGVTAVDNEISVQPPAVHAAPERPAVAPATNPRLAPVEAHVRWVLSTQDNEGLPFAVIDKRAARLWLYDVHGRRRGSTPVLLGLARSDASVSGIGDRPMDLIRAHERITPAGRFVAEAGRNADGEDVYWVDYDAAISMHRVRATNPLERRLQRLASSGAADNRISYGCINVPAAFYDQVIRPLFGGAGGVVYLLPETLPAGTLFRPADPL